MISGKSLIWVSALFICGCTPFGGFKPPPSGWMYYAANGATQRDIEVAYLECGFPVPGDFRDYDRDLLVRMGFGDVKKQYAALAAMHYCMKNAGFPTGGRDPCEPLVDVRTEQLIYPDYPVCKTDALIPKRSVENRINSPFCKLYPKAQVCQLYPYVHGEAVNHSMVPIIVPQYPKIDRVTPQVQKDSNNQMNKLLEDTNPRK